MCVCVGRGRRKLDFKRFQGKSLFLDLPGYRQVAWLEEELTARGAVSEGGQGEEREGVVWLVKELTSMCVCVCVCVCVCYGSFTDISDNIILSSDLGDQFPFRCEVPDYQDTE